MVGFPLTSQRFPLTTNSRSVHAGAQRRHDTTASCINSSRNRNALFTCGSSDALQSHTYCCRFRCNFSLMLEWLGCALPEEIRCNFSLKLECVCSVSVALAVCSFSFRLERVECTLLDCICSVPIFFAACSCSLLLEGIACVLFEEVCCVPVDVAECIDSPFCASHLTACGLNIAAEEHLPAPSSIAVPERTIAQRCNNTRCPGKSSMLSNLPPLMKPSKVFRSASRGMPIFGASPH